MSATTAPAALAELRTPAEVRRARIIGIIYLALAAFVLFVFAVGTEGNSTFGLARAGDRFANFPDLVLPSAGLGYTTAAVLAFFGGIQLTRGFGKRSTLVLGIGLLLFIFAFLGWAAAGKEFSLVGMLQLSVTKSVPITFGALSGVMCERVAVINIGIEGMLLGGAFMGALIGSSLGPWVGILAGMATGGLLALGLAVLAIRYRVDQIIAGVVINIFALGLTSFLTSQILVRNPDLNDVRILAPYKIPLLGDIPVIGPILFDHNFFVYAMFVLVGVMTFGLFRTRWGLRSRAVGEHPKAADTVGINVFKLRYWNVMLGGLIAGMGGAFFTIGSAGSFDENMTAGRGFIGLAAMIFGRWHPVGALGAGLVFGFADSLQNKLAILQTPIPGEFLLMAPYIVTMIVVAGLVGKARPPSADGQPYVKE